MKQTISVNDFRDAFRNMGRSDNFSYHGIGVLFDYFEEIDDNMELDVIAICCEYTEYDDVWEVIDNYNIDVDDCDHEDENEISGRVYDYLCHNTSIVCFESDCIIIADF